MKCIKTIEEVKILLEKMKTEGVDWEINEDEYILRQPNGVQIGFNEKTSNIYVSGTSKFKKEFMIS
jgi:hypothetical protein